MAACWCSSDYGYSISNLLASWLNNPFLLSADESEYIKAIHSFHLLRSYFFTSYSVYLNATYLRVPEIKLSVVYVKNVLSVLLNMVWFML